MRSDPLSERRVHDSFTSGSDGDGLGHLALARLGDPSDFGSESFNVSLFFVQGCLSHEHGEVHILDAMTLELSISEGLNLFPDVVGGGSQDIAA